MGVPHSHSNGSEYFSPPARLLRLGLDAPAMPIWLLDPDTFAAIFSSWFSLGCLEPYLASICGRLSVSDRQQQSRGISLVERSIAGSMARRPPQTVRNWPSRIYSCLFWECVCSVLPSTTLGRTGRKALFRQWARFLVNLGSRLGVHPDSGDDPSYSRAPGCRGHRKLTGGRACRLRNDSRLEQFGAYARTAHMQKKPCLGTPPPPNLILTPFDGWNCRANRHLSRGGVRYDPARIKLGATEEEKSFAPLWVPRAHGIWYC